ncbi:NADP-dependent oxidoreductase domain-containing protein [Mycena galericulata]|nr:NADP-dependent oxidoreductase domain-containing protein [Mycena galericulata]
MALTLQSTVRLSSGFHLPLLGFGVYQNYDAKPSVLEALKAGYRHIDTAQVYRNEGAVGEAVRESGLKREDIFITTKCVSRTHGYESTLKGVDTSLKTLGVEYVDLFLIHDPLSGKERRLETYKALLEAQAAGKIRSVGVSNYGVHHLEELKDYLKELKERLQEQKPENWKELKVEMPAVNQIELHPLLQQKPIVDYCKANSIVVQAYCPIMRGDEKLLKDDAVTKIASKYNVDPTQVVLRWSLQKGYVPLPKSATPSRIHSNAQLYDFELDGQDMAQIDALDRGYAISWNPVNAE